MPFGNHPMNYHIIADDAFALQTWLMKPFSKTNLGRDMQIFNYRLSRARRTVENAFGILNARFRCLSTPLEMAEDKAISIVLGCCTLHNMLCALNEHEYLFSVDQEDENTGELIPGSWRDHTARNTYERLRNMRGHRPTVEAKTQREYIMQYFCSDAGSVSWQENNVHV